MELYHVDVVLNTLPLSDRADSRLWLCALEPPGNIARDIGLYRRRFFREFGIPSACMYPAIVTLSCSAARTGLASASRYCELIVSAIQERNLAFGGNFPVFAEDSLYLGMESGLPELRRFLDDLARGDPGGISPIPARETHFLLPGAGFFVCRTDGPGEFPSAGILPPPIRFSFRDCSVSLYRVDSGDGFRYTSHWTLLAKARRKTGSAG